MTMTATTKTTAAVARGTICSVGVGGGNLRDDSDTASGTSGAPSLCQPIAAGQFARSFPRGGQRYGSPARGSSPLCGGKKYSFSDCSTDSGGGSSSSAIGSDSKSAMSCCGHAARETVFCKDFPSVSRGLAPITGQGVSGGCSNHFLHGSALGVAGGGSDHLVHGSASKADPYSNLEDKMWSKHPVLLQRSYPLTT
jgi:hypothetical protein